MAIANKYIRMEADQAWINLIKYGIGLVVGSGGTVWTINQFINRYFDYKIKQQSKFIEDVVDRKVTPEISELKNAIDELREAVWALKNKVS